MGASLKMRIRQDLIAARKQRDKKKTVVFSTLLAELKNREIELGAEVDDDEVQALVNRAIKQRKDAAEQMRNGGRADLAEEEEAEAALLARYLPPQLDEAEVRALVRELIDGGADEMGPLMGRLMPSIQGKFDGKQANRIVREELQGR